MIRLGAMWHKYWFRPSPLADLAIVRIVAVAFQLYYVTNNATGYYYDRLLGLSRLPEALYEPLLILRLLIWPVSAAGEWYRPSFTALLAIYWLTMAVGILALIGLKTNFHLLLFTIGNLFLQAFQYSFHEFHHPEGLMMMALIFLTLSPSGAVLSVDHWRHRRRNNTGQRQSVMAPIMAESSTFARWPLLLIRYMFSLIYLSAALNKLIVGGVDWVNGYTLQFYLLYDGMRWERSLGLWLGHQHTLAWLLSWVTIWFEWTFFLILIFPILTWLYVPLGIALHLGIELTMGATFSQFIVLYTAFIPWTTLFNLVARPFSAVVDKSSLMQSAR